LPFHRQHSLALVAAIESSRQLGSRSKPQSDLHRLKSSSTCPARAAPVGTDAVAGTPHALPLGSVATHVAQVLGWLNAHESAPAGAHKASAISATPHSFVASASVA